MIQVTFNISSSSDRNDLMKILNSLNEDYDESKDLDKHRKNPSQQEEMIQKLQEELATAKTGLTSATKENSDLKEKSKQILAELENTKSELKKMHSIERDNLLLEECKEKLDEEINNLKRQLHDFSSVYGSDSSLDRKYFEVEDGKLIETLNDSATYVASDSKFSFNKIKGEHKKACASRNILLEPFCDISSIDPESDYVETINFGEYEIIGEKPEIISKAKIKLIKS